jgi:hypothetical protein
VPRLQEMAEAQGLGEVTHTLTLTLTLTLTIP